MTVCLILSSFLSRCQITLSPISWLSNTYKRRTWTWSHTVLETDNNFFHSACPIYQQLSRKAYWYHLRRPGGKWIRGESVEKRRVGRTFLFISASFSLVCCFVDLAWWFSDRPGRQRRTTGGCQPATSYRLEWPVMCCACRGCASPRKERV